MGHYLSEMESEAEGDARVDLARQYGDWRRLGFEPALQLELNKPWQCGVCASLTQDPYTHYQWHAGLATQEIRPAVTVVNNHIDGANIGWPPPCN